ncbi:hypothetical protein BVRB_9g215080 [Beta vulgaris subsp. vulgaris]|nr:hypothetical protein BVRB_9g215080 [Beta vulgaris subsp. vulgaris]
MGDMGLKRKRKGSSSCSADSTSEPKPKPKPKQISASTSKRPIMHWETEWNYPFLDLLDNICKGRERSIGRAFNNEFWRAFAELFCNRIGRSGITAEECKERVRFFEQKYRDYKGYPAENDEDRKIFSLFHRDPVPKAPRAPADCGASSQASGSRSCSRPRSRSVARSYTASVVPTPEQQKAAVCEALSSLVRHKNLKFSSNDNIAAELSSQAMAGTFLDHNEDQRVNLIVEKFGTDVLWDQGNAGGTQ